MTLKHRIMTLALAMTLIMALVAPIASAQTEALTLEKINEFLNTSAALGEGSKANPVAVIPFNHIDGPREEDTFYGFVTFKYVARNYIKYQVSFVSCTCRSADVNFWSTAYLELTLPESGLLDDAAIRTLSFDKDSTGHYSVGVWGDSSPIPTAPQTYELITTEYLPYYVGKTYGQIKGLNTTFDIDLADYQTGEGRGEYTLDAYTGATVSINNVLRVLHAMFKHHGTDPYFANDPSLVKTEAAVEAPVVKPAPEAAVVASGELAPLPASVDETKTFKKNKDDAEEVPCTPGDFGPTCSSIGPHNLLQYLNRSDTFYIDLRDHNDYMKKHFRNFEVIPFFGLVFNADAHTDSTLPHLYGGTLTEPVPVYEESDDILKALFPKDKTLFIMCQSGGRVGMLMNILKARGWDMSKVYNIGGMAQYTGAEYKALITDTPEMVMEIKYSMESLTRIDK
jgi:rhodanese-related sulfurtransferase